MNDYELIQLIRNINVIEDSFTDYTKKERNAQMIEKYGRVDVTGLTTEQAAELGFGLWSKDNPIYLIPFYLYDFLAYGQVLESFDGDVVTVSLGYNNITNSNYIDNDYRFGCLAYGFRPKE